MDFRQRFECSSFVSIFLLCGDQGVHELVDELLRIPHNEGVEKRRYGFRVDRAGSSGDHERKNFRAVLAFQGHAPEIKKVQNVGVTHLVGKRKADHVEIGERPSGLQGQRGDAFLAHQIFHVRPGTEKSLRCRVFPAVQQMVDDPEAEMRHADLICIGKHQGESDPHGVRVLMNRSHFRAQIATRLAHSGQ